MNTEIVMEDSGEAASYKTVTGWVSRTGQFWGTDERMARYCGSTHKTCKCGVVVEQRSYCRACHDKVQVAKFEAKEKTPWDGVSMIYSDAHDRYFSDTGEVSDYAYDNELSLASLRLIICEPTMAREIDYDDHYCDDLPEDGEIPADIADAFEELNAVIRACTTPLSWSPGEFALCLEGVE